MQSRDWRLRLEDMLEAIGRIARYTAGMDWGRFAADDKTIDAVVRNLEIIGEAARHTPEEVTRQHPEIPWEKMRGIRNLLAHEYFGVDVNIVWLTVTTELPALAPLMRAILDRTGDDA